MIILYRKFYKRVLIFIISNRLVLPFVVGVVTGLALNFTSTLLFDDGCDSNESTYLVFKKQRDADMVQTYKIAQDDSSLSAESNAERLVFHSKANSEENYEPRLVTRDPIEVAHKIAIGPKKIERPRYYSTELNIKKKLFVAVLTKSSMLETFAPAFNKTLATHVDQLVFYVPAKSVSDSLEKYRGLGFLVKEISGPSLKTSLAFGVLKQLHAEYCSVFDYFLLVSSFDERSLTYVNGYALRRTLSDISVGRPLHLGVLSGQGTYYCTLSAGIVLSGSLVAAAAGSVPWCGSHTDGGVDASLGRCIVHATALPCNSIAQAHVYRSVDVTKGASTPASLHDLLDEFVKNVYEENNVQEIPGFVNDALPFTVTGLRQPNNLLAVHQYFLAREVALAQLKMKTIREDILETWKKSPLKSSDLTWPLGSPAPHQPMTRYDVISWITFNASHVFMPNDHRNTEPLRGALLEDITSVVLASASHISNISDGTLQLQRLEYGHYRSDPVRGTDYLLSLVFRNSRTGALVHKIAEAARVLTQPEFVPMPYITEAVELTILTSVTSDQPDLALQFIENFVMDKTMCSNAVLLLVLLQPRSRRVIDAFKSIRDASNSPATEGRVKFMSALTAPPGNNAPELYVLDQVVRRVPQNGLVFIVPVTARLSSDVLNRVRMNTIQGWQVFAPIMYALFHPFVVSESDAKAYANWEVKSNVGHYLDYDYSAISFYMSDYKKGESLMHCSLMKDAITVDIINYGFLLLRPLASILFFTNLYLARKLASNLFPLVWNGGTLYGLSEQQHQPRAVNDLSVYRLLAAYTNLHIIRAPEPFLRLPYDNLLTCRGMWRDSSDLKSIEELLLSDEASAQPADSYNELSDVSLLLGDSRTASDAAFYTYSLNRLRAAPRSFNYTLADFPKDNLCQQSLLRSIGTRAQLAKLVMMYDEKHGDL